MCVVVTSGLQGNYSDFQESKQLITIISSQDNPT